jgi:hypothetical protein
MVLEEQFEQVRHVRQVRQVRPVRRVRQVSQKYLKGMVLEDFFIRKVNVAFAAAEPVAQHLFHVKTVGMFVEFLKEIISYFRLG